MKSLFQFYYRPSPGSRDFPMLIYEENFQEALEVAKGILNRDFGHDGESRLIKHGSTYRHEHFTDFPSANNQLGPGRCIASELPPDQLLDFLQNFCETADTRVKGVKNFLNDCKMLLKQKQAERRLEEMKERREGLRRREEREQGGVATIERERVSDVARDW